MRPRKPLKLLLNFKLWGKLFTIVTSSGKYAFATEKSHEIYSCLYGKDGNKILEEDFRVLGNDDCFIYVVSKRASFSSECGYYLSIINLESCKIIKSFTVNDFLIEMVKLDDFKYGGENVYAFENEDTYTICDALGTVLYENIVTAEVYENKFFCINNMNRCFYKTKYTEGTCDVIANTKKDEDVMFLLGKIVNGEVLYTAMGAKGHAPCDCYFKRYSEEKDGIVVRPCNKAGEESVTDFAFIERQTGKVTYFENASSLSAFEEGRVFVTRRKSKEEATDDNWYSVELCYYDGYIVDIYDDIYFGFIEIPYDMYERTFAAVKEDGEIFYVDVNGGRYPIPKREKHKIKKDGNISIQYREFVDPLEA